MRLEAQTTSTDPTEPDDPAGSANASGVAGTPGDRTPASGSAGAAGPPTTPDGRTPTGGTDVPAGRRARLGRLAAAAVVVALVGMWAYVVYLAFGPGRQPPVDRLDHPAFARAAEDRCAAAVADVDELPPAQESPTPRDRAEVLDQANATFAVMLDDLRDLARLAPAGDQRQRVQQWLTDWETYLDDRLTYAENLRTDPQARFLISEKGDTGRHITGWIDEFAKANRMPSCATPTDV